MPVEAKKEPLQTLTLTDTDVLLDNVKLMLQFGYEGSISIGPNRGRVDMTMPDGVPISASLGDTILYRTSPAPAVVRCVTAEQLAAEYDIV